jgi:hypothetical protein
MTRRPRPRPRAPTTPHARKRGIYLNKKGNDADTNLVDKVADFSYESDALAKLIVEMWLGQHPDLTDTTKTLLQRSATAKTTLDAFGVHFQKPIVITEVEYDAGFSLADVTFPDGTDMTTGVVLVVPDSKRANVTVANPPGGSSVDLLETAKMLMAVTPNGI